MKSKRIFKFCTLVAILGICGWAVGCSGPAPATTPRESVDLAEEAGSGTGGGTDFPAEPIDDPAPTGNSDGVGEPESGDTARDAVETQSGDSLAPQSGSKDGRPSESDESKSGDAALPEEDATEEDETEE